MIYKQIKQEPKRGRLPMPRSTLFILFGLVTVIASIAVMNQYNLLMDTYAVVVMDYMATTAKTVNTSKDPPAASDGSDKTVNTSSNDQPALEENPVVLVTGSSSNHFDALFYLFLPSVFSNPSLVKERQLVVIFYDLGLNNAQKDLLRQEFPQILYRKFDYQEYPSHVNIHHRKGAYAWKPIIMNLVATEFRHKLLVKEQISVDTVRKNKNGIVTTTTTTTTTNTQKQPAYLFWLDAGCLFPTKDNFNQLVDHVKEKSLWSPFSGGTVLKWTHPGMVSYMGLDMKTVGDWNENGSGGVIGMNIMDDRLVDDILIPWMACAIVNNCIAPPGSSLDNHRFDQAALTLLMHIHGYEITTEWFHVGHHQDSEWRKAKREYHKAHPPDGISKVKKGITVGDRI